LSIEKRFGLLIVCIVIALMSLPFIFHKTHSSVKEKRAALLTELSGRRWTAEEVQYLNPTVTVIVENGQTRIEVRPERTP